MARNMKELLFNIPSASRKKFARHFLSRVFCEVGFSGVSIEALSAQQKDLADSMSQLRFSGNKEVFRSQVSFEGKVTQGSEAKVEQQSQLIGYAFQCDEKKVICEVHADKVVMTFEDYKGFESLQTLLSQVVYKVNEISPIQQVHKVGLRKVNSILMEKITLYEEACSIFNPAIFGMLRSGMPALTVEITEEVIVLQKEIALSVLRNSFKALAAPGSYEATLDFDVVNKRQSDLDSALTDTLKELNDIHFDLFTWAVTPKLTEMMEKEDG